MDGPTTPRSCIATGPRFGLFRVRSPLLTESRLISLPPGTEMVHFPGLARARLYIQRAVSEFYSEGFPHSDILGSKPACGSPRLIAAGHVLLRLLAPRHSPYALGSLTTKLTPRLSALPPKAVNKSVAFHKSALLLPSSPPRGRISPPLQPGLGANCALLSRTEVRDLLCPFQLSKSVVLRPREAAREQKTRRQAPGCACYCRRAAQREA